MIDSWPLAAGAAVLLALVFLSAPFQDVTRARIARFGLRQRLLITADNGAVVIAYLATTRRWRGCGLLIALGVAMAEVYTAPNGGAADLNLTVVFVGWFVGAVIAEWRVDSVVRGPRAVASLRPRLLRHYVELRVLMLLSLVWSTVFGAGLAGVISAARSRPVSALRPLIFLAGALVIGALIRLVSRRVLNRPQPSAAADVLAADNAVRGRSLRVLAGSAIAIGGYLAAASMAALTSGQGANGLVALVGYVVLPILGVLAAVGPRPVAVRPDPALVPA